MSKGLAEEVVPANCGTHAPLSLQWEGGVSEARARAPRSEQRLCVHLSVINLEIQRRPLHSTEAWRFYGTFRFSLRLSRK